MTEEAVTEESPKARLPKGYKRLAITVPSVSRGELDCLDDETGEQIEEMFLKQDQIVQAHGDLAKILLANKQAIAV